MTTIAQQFAAKIHQLTWSDLPPEAVHWAKVGILDTVGVTLAGAPEDCVRILLETPGVGEAAGPCLVFGRAMNRVSALDAGLINGVSSHALDFDDVNNNIGGHPSVPLVPAVFAFGEMLGRSGAEAILAYVVGFEAETRLGRAVNFHHYEKGWHPTATLGIFGTVAASARLLNLSLDETATALAMAVSLASGVKANFGTMTKPLHVGHSVRNGMLAALLAGQGMTANLSAFEHEQGFFEVFNGAGTYDAERLFADWANPLDVVDPGPGLKQFPCCGSTHAGINAMLEMVRDDGLRAEDVATIRVLTNPRRLPHTNNPDPRSGLEAKFSMHYVVAQALNEGRVGLDHFEAAAYDEPEVRAIMARVEVGEHPEMGRDSGNDFGAEVFVATNDGGNLSARIDHAVGRGPANPLSRDELFAKFADCAGRVLPEDAVKTAFETLQQLDEVADINDVTRILA